MFEYCPTQKCSNVRFGVFNLRLIILTFTGRLSTKPSLGPFITVEVGGSVIARFSNFLSPNTNAESKSFTSSIALPDTISVMTESIDCVSVFSGLKKIELSSSISIFPE